jgi:hypothetical protein
MTTARLAQPQRQARPDDACARGCHPRLLTLVLPRGDAPQRIAAFVKSVVKSPLDESPVLVDASRELALLRESAGSRTGAAVVEVVSHGASSGRNQSQHSRHL